MPGTGVIGCRGWLHDTYTYATPTSFAGHQSLTASWFLRCLHHVQGIILALFKDALPCYKSVV